MLRASLAALRLSMASWATFRFHSGVMAGGLTNVILWIICAAEETHPEAQHTHTPPNTTSSQHGDSNWLLPPGD